MTVLRDYAAATSQPTLGDPDGPGRFDEVVGPDGSLRPAWKGLAELIGLEPGYRLERLSGRFLAIEQQALAQHGRVQLAESPYGLDL